MSLDEIIDSNTREVCVGKAVRNRRDDRSRARQQQSSPYNRSVQESARRQLDSRRYERANRLRG